MKGGFVMDSVTREQICRKIPDLPSGSFLYWLLRAGVKPLPEKKIKNQNIVYLYPYNSIEKIKEKFNKRKIKK